MGIPSCTVSFRMDSFSFVGLLSFWETNAYHDDVSTSLQLWRRAKRRRLGDRGSLLG